MFTLLTQDVRYGLRTLVRTPGFSLAALITLALGIGATTTVFSIVKAVLFKRSGGGTIRGRRPGAPGLAPGYYTGRGRNGPFGPPPAQIRT